MRQSVSPIIHPASRPCQNLKIFVNLANQPVPNRNDKQSGKKKGIKLPLNLPLSGLYWQFPAGGCIYLPFEKLS
jgi:hypothetical protein